MIPTGNPETLGAELDQLATEILYAVWRNESEALVASACRRLWPDAPQEPRHVQAAHLEPGHVLWADGAEWTITTVSRGDVEITEDAVDPVRVVVAVGPPGSDGRCEQRTFRFGFSEFPIPVVGGWRRL